MGLTNTRLDAMMNYEMVTNGPAQHRYLVLASGSPASPTEVASGFGRIDLGATNPWHRVETSVPADGVAFSYGNYNNAAGTAITRQNTTGSTITIAAWSTNTSGTYGSGTRTSSWIAPTGGNITLNNLDTLSINVDALKFTVINSSAP